MISELFQEEALRRPPLRYHGGKWLQAITQRLRGVTIECGDAMEVIPRQDSSDTLFYVDPPYLMATRNNYGKGYRHEMTDHEHRSLGWLLKQVKGKVVLSGYGNDLYDRELYRDWTRSSKEVMASGQKQGVKRTEVVWLNF